MTEYRRVTPRGASERVYRALLGAYPRDFRDEFGDAMLEFHRDRLAQARARQGWLRGPARVWIRVLIDLLRNALPARVDELRRRLRRRADERDALRASTSLTSETKGDAMLSTILQDIRLAFRAMRRAKGFTVTVGCPRVAPARSIPSAR